MTLRRGQLSEYTLPFVRPLRTAVGVLDSRRGAWLRIEDSEGFIGVGELAPLRAFSPVSFEMARAALEVSVRELEGSPTPRSVDEIRNLVVSAALPPSAAYALELALLDGLGQRERRSVASLISETFERDVALSRLVHDVEGARRAVADGITTVKLKVGSLPVEQDLMRVAELRTAVGRDVGIRLDANGAWTPAEARTALTELVEFEPELVEDPVSSMEEMAVLRRLGVPLAADAPITGAEALEHAISVGAADAIVLKPVIVGGLLPGFDLATRAVQAGCSVVVTTMLDAAVGRRGALHLAAAIPAAHRLPCGLDTGGLLADDIAEEPRRGHGTFRCSVESGLGFSRPILGHA